MSYFVIDFKLRSEEKRFLKCYFLPTLSEKVWQSMESMAMYEFGLKSKEYLSYSNVEVWRKCGNRK